MSLDLKRLQGAALAPVLPASINSFTGDTSTLSWNVTGATSVTISGGIGAVALVGTSNHNISNPNDGDSGAAYSFTFTLTAINGGLTTSASITIYWDATCYWATRGHPEWC